MALHHCSARATKFLVNFLSGQANFSPGPPGRPVIDSVFLGVSVVFSDLLSDSLLFGSFLYVLESFWAFLD